MSLSVLIFFFLSEIFDLFGWYDCIRIVILRHGIWYFNNFCWSVGRKFSLWDFFARLRNKILIFIIFQECTGVWNNNLSHCRVLFLNF